MTKKELRYIFKEKRKALSVHDIEKFNDRKQCIIEQYSNFSVPHLHMNVSAILNSFFLNLFFYYSEQW